MSELRCSLCGKYFAKANSLSKHKSRSHPEKPPDKFECFYCDYKTVYKFNLSKHMNKVHFDEGGALIEKKVPSQPLKVCNLCNNFKCNDRSKMIEHYVCMHDVPVSEQCFKFNTFDEFLTWKRDIESQEYCRFVAATSLRKRLTKHVWFFRCFRDGHYVPRGKGRRSLKVKGSVKIDSVCPCSMKVTKTLDNGSVNVMYVTPHVGHKPDVSRLTLTKEEREFIASKISSGVSDEELLRSLRDSLSFAELSRLHLTTRKDLWNIKNATRTQKRPAVDERLSSAACIHKRSEVGELISNVTFSQRRPEVDEPISSATHILKQPKAHLCISNAACLQKRPKAGEPSNSATCIQKSPVVDERTKYKCMKQALIDNISNLIDSTKNCAQLEVIRKAFLPLAEAVKALESDL